MKTIIIITVLLTTICSTICLVLNRKKYKKDKDYIMRKANAFNIKVSKGGFVAKKEQKELEMEAAMISLANIVGIISYVLTIIGMALLCLF